MSEVTREEFDALVARVAAMDDRTSAQFGHIFVELHNINAKLSNHDEQFANIGRRFDSVDTKLDEIIGRLP